MNPFLFIIGLSGAAIFVVSLTHISLLILSYTKWQRQIRIFERHDEVTGRDPQHDATRDDDDRTPTDFALLIDAIKSEGAAARAEYRREDDAKTSREWIAIAVVSLTLIAIGWQVYEMIEAYGPIEAQSRAAFSQLVAMQNSERARFAIQQLTLHRNGDNDPGPTVGFTLVNVGRSAAVVTGIYMECYIADKFTPGYLSTTAFRYGNNAVVSNSIWDVGEKAPCHLPTPLTENDWASVRKHERGFLAKGFVQFSDVFGRMHVQHLTSIAFEDGIFYPLPSGAGNDEINETDSQMEKRLKFVSDSIQ